MRPLIGITCSADDDGGPVVRPWYVRAVHDAGGLPVALPFVADVDEAREVLARLAGVVLTGSEDLDPALWGEERHPATDVMPPARHAAELAWCRALVERRPPTLAICGGMQTLNVVAGGTLLQHVPDLPGEHEQHSDAELRRRHGVTAEPGSRLAALLGPAFETNTHHHQAIGRLGDGFVATARCVDGIVEGYECSDWPDLLAVQWHPERMTSSPEQCALFRQTVEAAAGEPSPAA